MQICPSGHPMKTCGGGSRRIALLVLNLDTKRTGWSPSGPGRLAWQLNPGLSCHFSSRAPGLSCLFSSRALPTPEELRISPQSVTCERLRFDIIGSHSGIAESQALWFVSLLLARGEHLIYSEMHTKFQSGNPVNIKA